MKNFFVDHLEFIPVTLSVLFVLAGIVIEFIISIIAGRRLYDAKDTLSNFAMYVGYLGVDLLWIPILFSTYAWVHHYSLFKLGDQWWLFRSTVPFWHWGLLFLLDDLCFYLFHRASHKVRFLWAAHVPHHSSNYFNLSVGIRQTWMPFFIIIFWLPLALIGFDPLMILLMQLISLTFQAFLHTQVVRSFGPFDRIFNSPSSHRVHHGSQSQYVDKNFGGVLIIWDRFFGSFEPEREKPQFGVGIQSEHNPIKIAFLEWWSLLKDVRSKGLKMLIQYDRRSND